MAGGAVGPAAPAAAAAGQQPLQSPSGLLPKSVPPGPPGGDHDHRQADSSRVRRRAGHPCWARRPDSTTSRSGRCLALARINRHRHLVRRAGRRRASSTSCRHGPRPSLAAVIDGGCARRSDRFGSRPASLSLARGLDYCPARSSRSIRLRVPSVCRRGGRYDALASGRPHDVPRCRDLLRHQPHPRALIESRPAGRRRKVPSAVLVALVDGLAPGQRPGGDRTARPGVSCEVAASPRSSAEADPLRRAAGDPTIRLVPGPRRDRRRQ